MENNSQNFIDNDKQIENSRFNLTLFLLDCLSHWKWFILSLIVVIGLSIFYVIRQVPQYNVNSMVLIIDKWSKSEGDVLTQSLGITSGAENILTEIEVMRSKTLLKKVAYDLDLYVSYEKKGRFRNTPLYRNTPITLRPDSTTDVNLLETTININISGANADNCHNLTANYTYEGQEKSITHDNVSFPDTLYMPGVGTYIAERNKAFESFSDEIIIAIKNPKETAKTIASNLTLTQHDKNTLLINVSYTTPIPEMGCDIINRIVHYYNQESIDEKNRSANNTEAFINNRLVAIQRELSEVEQNVEKYRSERGLTDISSEAQMYLQLTGESDKARSEIEIQRSHLKYVEEFLLNPNNTFASIPSLPINDPVLSGAINEYNKAITEREKLLTTQTEDNQPVIKITESIKVIKTNVLQSIDSYNKRLELEENDVARQEEEIRNKIRNMPQYERELTDIMRQQRIKENLFIFLLEKREENALTQALAVGDARIIDEPAASGIVSPKKNMIYFLAFLLGLLIPAAFIFIKRMIFPSFHDKVELERLTNIPVLAELPHNGSDNFFVVKEKSNNATSELFRLLRNNLQFLFTSPDKKVVMVTSSVSKEGKTFISTNLAISFSLTKKKTLIVGLDIRRPKAAHQFGVSNRHGIVNYLSGHEKNIDNIIQPTGYENLDIIPGGPIPPNPNELLLSPALDELIAELRKRYDYIILDTAPIGLVSDSLLIDRVVDINLFVTRARYTSISHVRNANAVAHTNKLKSMYMCINDVDMSTRAYSYRRYGNAYGTSTYGSYGYNDDENFEPKKKGIFSIFRKKK